MKNWDGPVLKIDHFVHVSKWLKKFDLVRAGWGHLLHHAQAPNYQRRFENPARSFVNMIALSSIQKIL